MSQRPETKQMLSRQEILDTTLIAVRKTKQLKQRNQSIMLCTCALFVITLVLTLNFRAHTPEKNKTATTPTHISTNTHASSIVNIADHAEVKTLTLSHLELARLIYDPSFKFIEGKDVYIWRSESMIIHMPLPTTMMAITESNEPDLGDDIL